MPSPQVFEKQVVEMLLGSNRDHIPVNRKHPQNISFNPVEALKRKGEIYALNINSKVLHYTMCFRLNLQSFGKKNTNPFLFRIERKRLIPPSSTTPARDHRIAAKNEQ